MGCALLAAPAALPTAAPTRSTLLGLAVNCVLAIKGVHSSYSRRKHTLQQNKYWVTKSVVAEWPLASGQ